MIINKKRKHNNIKNSKNIISSNNNHNNPPLRFGNRHYKLERQHVEARRQLPVFKYRNEICKLVQENEVLLVIAETVSL